MHVCMPGSAIVGYGSVTGSRARHHGGHIHTGKYELCACTHACVRCSALCAGVETCLVIGWRNVYGHGPWFLCLCGAYQHHGTYAYASLHRIITRLASPPRARVPCCFGARTRCGYYDLLHCTALRRAALRCTALHCTSHSNCLSSAVPWSQC